MAQTTYYSHYEYDGLLCRVTCDIETGEALSAEGYFQDQGFVPISLHPVLDGGIYIRDAEFKKKMVMLRVGVR